MSKGFFALCYHYIRQNNNDPFPRILGTKLNDFNEHVKMIKNEFEILSLDRIHSLYTKKFELSKDKIGLLVTFDDGLADQFEAAKILSENDISAVFFIPTCIVTEELPANPIILHYAIAILGIKKFIEELKQIFEELIIKNQNSIPEFSKDNDKISKIIEDIKILLYYKIKPEETRRILLEVYKKLLVKNNIKINNMHLTKKQIKKLLEMGHNIGTHSHTHISVTNSKLTKLQLKRELIQPKLILESEFNTNVISMSYPFGELKDCLSAQSLIEKTNSYELAFTIKHKFNTKNNSPLEIGRYMVHSTDNSSKLNKILKRNQL